MDAPTDCFMTPDLKRLVTFYETPIQNSLCKSVSNSASKFSQAGFERSSDAIDDVVGCRMCGCSYRDWDGESPIAVHRVISPNCRFLNSPPIRESVLRSGHLQEVRRQLFPASATPETSNIRAEQRVLHDKNIIKHPHKPHFGTYEMLFASHRLLTFRDLFNPKCGVWAENGFVYRLEGDVMCVYCGLVLDIASHQPPLTHARESPDCPFVLLFDVGNISRQEESQIRLKYFQQRQRVGSTLTFTVRYPEYESTDVRKETFKNWPAQTAAVFSGEMMSDTGFFFTNFSDKVMCYCCGVSVYGWHAGADVWTQHAKISPTCLHVLTQKGQHFVEQAAQAEVQTSFIRPEQRDGPLVSSNGVVGELPGSLTLSMTAIQGALSCLYPNETCLVATLKAEDENYAMVCEQRQTILCKDQALEKKEQEKQRAEQEKQRAVRQERQEKQALHTALQEKDHALREKDHVIQTNLQVIKENQQMVTQQAVELTRKNQELRSKDQELRNTKDELRSKDEQIALLLQRLQSLRAPQPPQADLQLPAANTQPVEPVEPNEDIPEQVRCKVCMCAESSVVLLPCHHVCCCANCVTSLHTMALDEQRRCPVCRTGIESTHPAFVA